MPAFMSIGKYDEATRWVDPDEIAGDVTGAYHARWIKITSFSVDMKDERRSSAWADRQEQKPKQELKDEKRKQEELKKEQKGKDEEPERTNTLRMAKPHDQSSMKIIDWVKSGVHHDIQIDCIAGEQEKDWPYLSIVFLDVVATKADIDDTPSDSLDFTWKRCITFTWEFDEQNEPLFEDFAEFGEEKPSGHTTAAQRGLADYTPPDPDLNEGAGQGEVARTMSIALWGGLPTVQEEKKAYDQERRRLSIGKVGDIEFHLESFRVEEYLSGLFVYDLELRSERTAIEPRDVIGHDVTLQIEDEEGLEDDKRDASYFSGIVTSLLLGEMVSDQHRRYHAVVMPTVWRLTQRSDSRVFQDVTVKDVVEKVFSEAGFSDYDMQGVTRSHPKMPYCVQYQESDFVFVSRLLEEFGIFYYFKQEKDEHTMMLCDGPTGYVRCPEDPLVFAHDVHDEPRITSWRQHYSFVPGKYALVDFNFETPQEPIKAESTSRIDLPGGSDAEVFEYPGRFADNDQGTTMADLRMQERETGHHFVHAVSCYDNLAPGMTIAVDRLPGEEANGTSERYLITEIRHHAEQLPEYGLSIVGYRNVFVAIPEKVTFTPARRTSKPRILGPQTAIVVGDKETDEEVVDTDKYGRVKVQFHWDRKGKKDTDSSCWMRVAQGLAGGGYGAMALPRIGWEVVVSFLDGDPDRPLVTGVVYNELHMPYHELPSAKHKTVLMTRSFPNGGKETFNELTFHDEKDKEEIYFHAERDFKRVVEHDDVLEVGEKETGGQTITIEGDRTLTISKGDCQTSIREGKETITVKGDRSITVSSGNQSVDVSAGKYELGAGQSIELKVGGSSVKIDSAGIVLKVGGSTVKVDNTGVTLKGMMIKGEASLAAELKGMMTTISGDGMLQTKGGITMMQ